MRSTKFWIILTAVFLLLSATAAALIFKTLPKAATANIYQNGALIRSVELGRVDTPFTIEITGGVENTVSVEHGRICVSSATCPDQVCVHQGWISNGVVPIVCLPNRLVIRIEDAGNSGIDGTVH